MHREETPLYSLSRSVVGLNFDHMKQNFFSHGNVVKKCNVSINAQTPDVCLLS